MSSYSKTAGTWRARFVQGEKQLFSFYWKYERLKELCGTEPKDMDSEEKRTNKTYKRWYLNTLTCEERIPIANLFYKWNQTFSKFVKVVPENIGEFLTPGVIAIWFQDDGSLKWKGHSNSVRFSTDSFSENELNYLKSGLGDYGIKVTSQKKREGWTLATSESSYWNLNFLRKDRFLLGFSYKFPNGNSQTLQDELDTQIQIQTETES